MNISNEMGEGRASVRLLVCKLGETGCESYMKSLTAAFALSMMKSICFVNYLMMKVLKVDSV